MSRQLLWDTLARLSFRPTRAGALGNNIMSVKTPVRRFVRRTTNDSQSFFLNDYGQTLFPLKTNRFLGKFGFGKLIEFGRSAVSKDEKSTPAFLPQRSVSALKAGWHQRRTVKLDPVAEAFIYDFMFRNRRLIRGAMSSERECYGYVFKSGTPLSPTLSYRGFKGAKSEYASTFKHSLSFDISSYFNSIYHHDLTEWAEDRGFSDKSVAVFGRFLREIKSGRSIDCLPQGLYPTKMIGNDFLKFVDSAVRLKSAQLIRFMDDIVIFSNKKSDLQSDFYLIQDLLGQRGLSINSAKTRTSEEENDVAEAVDEVKANLLRKRRIIVSGDYADEDDLELQFSEVSRNLTKRETDRLKDMLSEPHIEEEDAELILTLMGEHSSDVLERFDDLLGRYPNLSKNLHSFCRHVDDVDELARIVDWYLKKTSFVPEFQLFWIGMILEDYLLGTKPAGRIIAKLISHPYSTTITQAKILEIATSEFGLPELRRTHLQEGKSDWLAWSAAVGSRREPKRTRNHVLQYYRNASPINAVIADIVTTFDGDVFD